ncbi:hypothetical protein V8G54_019473 [Vigna mungo]|uniref:Pectin acetylesterase n=1 Tax=Vigna mungo TaxID=3915 RepID=A0AAQ3NBP7_VIGMU
MKLPFTLHQTKSFMSQQNTEIYCHFCGREGALWRDHYFVNSIDQQGDMLTKSLKSYRCSAGGLAALIHCDNFRQLLPKEATVKCLSDAGFFLDEKDISGNSTMRSFYHDVTQLQGLAKSLHKDCIDKMEPYKAEIVKNIKTPLFLVHPAYDFWQIRNILVPQGSDPLGHWQSCRRNIRNCDANMIDKLDGYRGSLLKTLNEFQQRKEIGMFINSCFIHCQTEMEVTWHSSNSPKINDKKLNSKTEIHSILFKYYAEKKGYGAESSTITSKNQSAHTPNQRMTLLLTH